MSNEFWPPPWALPQRPPIGMHESNSLVFLDSRSSQFTMRWFGKTLQVLGLIALPLGMVLQLVNILSLGDMLKLLVVGAAAFYLGRFLEGYSR